MQVCSECDYVYDESEYAQCPNCHGYDSPHEKIAFVTDSKTGEVIQVPTSQMHLYE